MTPGNGEVLRGRISSKCHGLCDRQKILSTTRNRSTAYYIFSFWSVLLLLQTSSFQMTDAEEVTWSYAEANINETDSMTTVSWLQLMGEDAEDRDKELVRSKREIDHSGEGSGTESTTVSPSPEETTGPYTTDEVFGATTVFDTTFTSTDFTSVASNQLMTTSYETTDISSAATNKLTMTTHEDTTVPDESETLTATTTYQDTTAPFDAGTSTATFRPPALSTTKEVSKTSVTDADDITTGSGETQSTFESTMTTFVLTATSTTRQMGMEGTTDTTDFTMTSSDETESTFEPATASFGHSATTNEAETAASTEEYSGFGTTTAVTNVFNPTTVMQETASATIGSTVTSMAGTSAATSLFETMTTVHDTTGSTAEMDTTPERTTEATAEPGSASTIPGLDETESTLEPATTSFETTATTNEAETDESTEGSSDLNPTTAATSVSDTASTTQEITPVTIGTTVPNMVETSAATSPLETTTTVYDTSDSTADINTTPERTAEATSRAATESTTPEGSDETESTFEATATTNEAETAQSTKGLSRDTTTVFDSTSSMQETTPVSIGATVTNVVETSAAASLFETATTTTENDTTDSTAEINATPERTTETTDRAVTESITQEPVCSLNVDSSCPTNQYCVESSTAQLECICSPGYTLDDSNLCSSPVKQFGGELHIDEPYDAELEIQTSELYMRYVEMYENFIGLAYAGEDWFESVEIVGFEEGSIVVQYKLKTEDNEDIDSSTIQSTFSEFLANTTYFPECSCEDTQCNSTIDGVTVLVLADVSCQMAGTATGVVCSSADNINYCDATTSTCVADENGSLECVCKVSSDDHPPNSSRSCTSCNYQAKSGCNEPFGTCRTNGACSCNWGFQGRNCTQVWLFTLVVSLSGLALIVIITIAIVCWRRRRSAKRWKKSWSMDGNYIENDVLSVSTQRSKKHSKWSSQTGGVVPTFYKSTTIDFEPYDDSMFANAKGLTKTPEEESDRPPSLGDGRLSELSNGNHIEEKLDFEDKAEYSEINDSGTYFQQTTL